MNNLSNTVFAYYLGHFNELTPPKQFHFASRLYLWTQEPKMLPLLEKLRPEFIPNENPASELRQIAANTKQAPLYDGSENALNFRKTYFAQYPNLKIYNAVLFRMLFLKNIYGLDTTDLFFNIFPKPDVEATLKKLLGDPKALSILSTRAINFIYLYKHLIKTSNSNIPVKNFLEIGKTEYDLSDPGQIQLLIYFYTHCVLGDSRFYYRHVPSARKNIYRSMLEYLEPVIEQSFKVINLDCKFEFLVAAQIIGFKTSLRQVIFKEAEGSVSPSGNFLVDTLNDFPQSNKTDLNSSEHRNVLFIMAARPFKPLG